MLIAFYFIFVAKKSFFILIRNSLKFNLIYQLNYFISPAFSVLMKTKQTSIPSSTKKIRPQGGHSNTHQGVCITCHDKKRSKYILSRYNKSFIDRHITTVHNKDETKVEILPADHPKAAALLKR